MSQKEKTTGEEFENFLSLTIKYRVNIQDIRNMKQIRFVIPKSEIRKKAISLGLSESDFYSLSLKVPVYNIVTEEYETPNEKSIKELTSSVFNPTTSESKIDQRQIKKLTSQRVDFEKLQEDLSSLSPFKEFLSRGNS